MIGAAAIGSASLALGGQVKRVPRPRLQRKLSTSPGSAYLRYTEPLPKVRIGFIGMGARGPSHLDSAMACEGVEIVAICDNHLPSAQKGQAMVAKAGRPAAKLYTNGEHDFERMLRDEHLDAVFIATPWPWHVPMAVAAMKAGVHALVEVPASPTLDGCWELVETAERTGRHCMMLENVNYGREELMVLNMIRQGALGELLHGEAAYIHDLRDQMHEIEHGTGSWRTLEYTRRNGNLYPTHGLGPVAHYMDINRGDRFDYLASVSSPSRSRALYAQKEFPAGSDRTKLKFVCGDINTSIIKTVRGRTIMIQWDEQLPRPYTRLNFIQGTRGAWGGFPARLAVEGLTKGTEEWAEDAALDPIWAKYDHPLWVQLAKDASLHGGHGGMDFVMVWRIVYCLRHGLPLDQDVYDAAAWSVVGPLSEWSVANRGQSIDFPDFTRGRWETMKPFEHLTVTSERAHFSPPGGWMNDPNGPIYFQGRYHLFYQHFDPKHWGHASSADLVSWKHHPTAISPDTKGEIWSGSAVIDEHDSSGFFGGSSGLVAIFTQRTPAAQRQSLAYSKDGETWTMHAGNPVLESRAPDFRDPKVVRNPKTGTWTMVVAEGRHLGFYTSTNLRDWNPASKFGERGEGWVWECPDLYQLGGHWVLHASYFRPGEEGDLTKNTMLYFVGDLTANGFQLAAGFPTEGRLMTHGPDDYAPVGWDAPDGRRIVIGWMNRWQYAGRLFSEGWAPLMTLPRQLSLDSNLHLRQLPAVVLSAPANPPHGPWEKTWTAKEGDKGKIMFGDAALEWSLASGFHVDRKAVMHPEMTPTVTAPVGPGPVSVRVVVDTGSVEFFLDGGRFYVPLLVDPRLPAAVIKPPTNR